MLSAVRKAVFGNSPSTRVFKSDEEKQRVEKIWAELMIRPAHEYLGELLKTSGLKTDISKLLQGGCSFWIKDPDGITGTPCVARVEAINQSGNVAVVHITGPSAKPSKIYLYWHRSGAIQEQGQSGTRNVTNFQFL